MFDLYASSYSNTQNVELKGGYYNGVGDLKQKLIYQYLPENFIQIKTGQVDHRRNIHKNQTFETGYKFSNISTKSQNDFIELSSGQLIRNPQFNIDFRYKESIHAGYISISGFESKWEWKVGLRRNILLHMLMQNLLIKL